MKHRSYLVEALGDGADLARPVLLPQPCPPYLCGIEPRPKGRRRRAFVPPLQDVSGILTGTWCHRLPQRYAPIQLVLLSNGYELFADGDVYLDIQMRQHGFTGEFATAGPFHFFQVP